MRDYCSVCESDTYLCQWCARVKCACSGEPAWVPLPRNPAVKGNMCPACGEKGGAS